MFHYRNLETIIKINIFCQISLLFYEKRYEYKKEWLTSYDETTDQLIIFFNSSANLFFFPTLIKKMATFNLEMSWLVIVYYKLKKKGYGDLEGIVVFGQFKKKS